MEKIRESCIANNFQEIKNFLVVTFEEINDHDTVSLTDGQT
jgi:hypothetical protein